MSAVASAPAHDVYELEAQAVSALTGADTADLEHLLSLILPQRVSRQQVQPLLETAWRRLQAAREHTESLPDAIAADERQQVQQTLGTGPALSLALALRTLSDAQARVEAGGANPELLGQLYETRAYLAGASLDFENAARSCSSAANAVAADTPKWWHYRYLQVELLIDAGREFRRIEALQKAESVLVDDLLPLTTDDARRRERAKLQDKLGQVLGLLGHAHRGTHMLERAATAFEQALSLWNKERDANEWSATQNHLGNALGALGQRQKDEDLLDSAIGAFDAALQVQSAQACPEAWASTLNNLAAVLQSVGQQRKESKLLKRSVDSYRSVLTVWSKEHKPLFWAATMSNLGAALRMLGGTRKGPRTLEQAVAAYNAALSVRTRERLPREWAMTKNDLGAALQAVGERNDDQGTLRLAIAAYEEALQAIARHSEPMTWAMTMANVGVARRNLAERGGDVDIARQAVDNIQAAVTVFNDASHAQLAELGGEQLFSACQVLAAIEPSR